MKKDISIMIDDVKFTFRVGVIFEYKDKIIIEYSNRADYGVIPGGRVMTQEDTKGALIREIQEEMHFDISQKDMELVNIIENFFKMNNTKYHELYFVYKIKLEDTDKIVNLRKEEFINYDSESGWYEFVKIADIDKMNIKPEKLKEIIKKSKFDITIVRDI